MTAEEKRRLILVREGFQNPDAILHARNAAKLGLPLACALLTQESGGGYNVWGHDPTNFIGGFDHYSGTHWGSRVTKEAYAAYKAQRGAHGNQGVGPCQLTSPGLQDQADAAGGCWVPQHNMAVGFHFMHDLIKTRGGLIEGVTAYNGSGPAADAYARHLLALAQHYKDLGLGTVIGTIG